MIDRRPTVRLAALLAAAALLASACSGFGTSDSSAEAPADDVVVSEQRSAPAPTPTDDAALERRVSSLELQLLEKTQQAQELQARLDDARREVVRAMAKLQSLATRAEAASGIAEVELALESLPATASTQAVAEVRQLMEQSSAEFDRANYGGTLYLANQAKSAATAAHGQSATVEQSSLRPYERSLALPLQLETRTGANVRAGPGTTFAVLFTLPPEAPVVAYSSADEWLRIADDAGRRGWISQSLIRARP